MFLLFFCRSLRVIVAFLRSQFFCFSFSAFSLPMTGFFSFLLYSVPPSSLPPKLLMPANCSGLFCFYFLESHGWLAPSYFTLTYPCFPSLLLILSLSHFACTANLFVLIVAVNSLQHYFFFFHMHALMISKLTQLKTKPFSSVYMYKSHSNSVARVANDWLGDSALQDINPLFNNVFRQLHASTMKD